jgi:DNA-binding MarR family transcriptional regulator
VTSIADHSYRDYLEARYEMAEEGIPTQQARLAEWLGVSPASVSEAVKRLTARGLVAQENAHRLALTDEGEKVVVRVEYAESVEDGEVVATPEYEGGRGALASSRSRYLEVREAVASVAPDTAAEIDRAYDELERLVYARAPTEEVATAAGELADMLTRALGG